MPTFAEEMVTKYETLLKANVGVKQVSVDGQSVTYAEIERRWEFWKKKVAEGAGTRPRAAQVNLDT